MTSRTREALGVLCASRYLQSGARVQGSQSALKGGVAVVPGSLQSCCLCLPNYAHLQSGLHVFAGLHKVQIQLAGQICIILSWT